MKFCNNNTLQEFVGRLVETLKRENEYRKPDEEPIDIPFLISNLCEDFNNSEKVYSDFIKDLRNCDSYSISIEEPSLGYWYEFCKVNIYFFYLNDCSDEEETKFKYEIEFNCIERNWGYCECSPNDPDYREDKHCCGHGCDWNAPEFEIRKSYLVSKHSWDGDEHDYWDFEDKFYANDKEENEKKLLAEREYKIRNLKETIENAQKELKKLENL